MKSFGFKNFRKFENFPMIDLGGINILVGTNNSGKSTAIKALMLTLLNAKREQTSFMRYESEKSMLPPFLYIFDFSFEVLEHLYLGDFKSALNYNDKTKEITISFEEGGTYFSFSFTSHIDERPSAYFTKSTVCNEHLGIKYDYVFDNSDLKHRGFLPSHGSVTCKFTIPIKDLERFKDSIEEHVAIYESLNSDKARHERTQFQKCLEDYKCGKDEFTLTYNFFRSHQYRSFSGGTPHCEFLKDFFSKKNNIIVKEFQSLPAVSYIETHNASHRLLLDKEDKNNYLAQTVSLYLRNCVEAQHKLESGFISKWMREFEVGAYLEIVDVYGEAYRVNVIDSDGHNVPLAHKGTGTIQLVTLLMRLASYDAEAGKRIVVIEEPEQNMHPKLQSKLADLLYEVWKESNGNLQFVVETHSEYLVRRLQVIAAEKIKSGVSVEEVNEDFKVYYFPEDGTPYSMDFQRNGCFEESFGPGFFDEAGNSYRALFKLERDCDMEDVYFTKRDLDNSIDTGNAIDKLMRNPRCRILVNLDSDAVSKMIEDSSPDILFSYLQGHGKTFYSGKEMVTAIKESVEKRTDKLSNGFSRSMLLLNEKDTEFAEKVERHFGIKCVLGKKGMSTLKEGKAPFFDEGENGTWNDTFSRVSAMPCNAIIINDHYLKGDNGTENLIDIIRNLSKQRAHDVTLHILVIYSCGKDGTILNKYHKFFSEQAERTAYKLAKLDAEMNYLLEYVYCDDTNSLWKLYKYTHDRFAISNYTSMDASHALELFNEEGKVKTEQKVTVGNLFYEDTLKMNNTFIRRIAKEIKEGIKDPENNPYKYIRYDIIKGECIKSDCTDLSKIQNRFIVDELSIKEGEICYYLSVPNDNNWAGTEILSGFYTAVNYSKCIVARKEIELEDKKNKLQQLFSKKCKAPENDDDKYWRVVVTGQSNIKTVHALESKSGEKVCNQVNNYLNNCFKYKEDALQRVDEIKAVLGIE